MESYKSASYQYNVVCEFLFDDNLYLYGPGYDNYDFNDTIEDVIQKAPFNPEIIILGHAWLNDTDGHEVDPHPFLQLDKTNIFKVVFFNKEYTNLEQKIKYIKQNKFNIGFSHHHDLNLFKKTDTNFIFSPFAYDDTQFKFSLEKKTYDIGFSGILQNLNKNAMQSDIRVKIMNLFFKTIIDVPIFKKTLFKDVNIFWNSISRTEIGRYLSVLLKKRKYLDSNSYSSLIQDSKIFINTLSPMGLISPRFFECMGSGALVFCQESKIYKNIFPDDIYVTFKEDLSDFTDTLFYYLDNDDARKKIVKKAYDFVSKNHTWKARIKNIKEEIKKNV